MSKHPAGASAHIDAGRLRGIILVLLAGAAWSTAGIIVRLLESAESWQIVFYRSAGLVPVLLVAIALRNQGRVLQAFRDAGFVALVGGASLSVAFTCFVFGVLNASVANVLFIFTAAPFLAALLGWIILGESVRPATWFGMVVGVLGVGIMVAGSIEFGGLLGNIFALMAASGFAGFTVCLRSRQQVDMYPAVCWAGLLSMTVAGVAAVVSGQGFSVSAWDLTLCLLLGVGQIGLGLILYTSGSRHLVAAELALLSLSEVVLGPIWVWIAVDEVPADTTLIGGVVVLAAILVQALSGMRRRPPPIGVA